MIGSFTAQNVPNGRDCVVEVVLVVSAPTTRALLIDKSCPAISYIPFELPYAVLFPPSVL